MPNYTNNQLQHLFLQQSCQDAWSEYERQMKNSRAIVWDYVVLTASNEEQAGIYRREIDYRLQLKQLPKRTTYLVLPDPEGKRVGSGGATLNVIKEIAVREKTDHFHDLRILVIHSGGDSKRIPQYSTCGKLFSPVPRVLPNGQSSTLFDEFMITTSMIPGRMQEGMLVMSGDVLLLFNALQIDTQFFGAAAISIKEPVETGANHGVFLADEKDNVKKFLHKQSVETLTELGAVNKQGKVNLDTGAILMDPKMIASLYSLISTNGHPDQVKFDEFVNEKVRISFYGDFLYPLAKDGTLQEYQKEAPEGVFCDELTVCREKIWEVLKDYGLKLICLSPAEFIHFGTTRELRRLVTEVVDDYTFLGWKKLVCSNRKKEDADYALHNAYLEDDVIIGQGAYVENSYLEHGVRVEKRGIVSGIQVPEGKLIRKNTVYHGLKLNDGSFIVRVYSVEDNPKGSYGHGGKFLGADLEEWIKTYGIKKEEIWESEDCSLWTANLYPACSTIKEAMEYADLLYRMAGKATASIDEKEYPNEEEINRWINSKRYSLYSGFHQADAGAIIPWRENLEDQIRVSTFVQAMMKRVPVKEALEVFGGNMRKTEQKLLLSLIREKDFSAKIRIYYGMATAAKMKAGEFEENDEENYMQSCFGVIQQEISELVAKKLEVGRTLTIERDQVDVSLPVRVNWGGGWTDTPPHCMELGGVVLNAAITLKGELPIKVSIRKLPEYVIELESQDIEAHGIFHSMEEVNDCSNPYDKFALHKAALIACGVIGNHDTRNLEERLKELGGGIYLSTEVINVPKGSGLGTSSILAGACVKGLFEFFGLTVDEDMLYDVVLSMEQLMSTGGGWQDQVGGLTRGIKMITTEPGLDQKIQVREISLSEETKKKLQERFALIYTGQRRLARNLLREVVGGYIGNRPESLDALHKMKRVASLMEFELSQGNIDGFAELLNLHWDLSIQLDEGSTNTCIEQIFLSVEDLICGKFISGAGGGGFLQVILKEGVTKEDLQERLYSIFQDSGVDVWECKLI